MPRASTLIRVLLALSGCSSAGTESLGDLDAMQDVSRPDQGVDDRGSDPTPQTGDPCTSDDQCPEDEFCIWWAPGCGPESEQGVCDRHTGLDACIGCNVFCDCEGVTRDGWSVGPWAHRGPCAGDADAGVAVDGS